MNSKMNCLMDRKDLLMLYWILCENSAVAKLVRTILQGFAGVLVAVLPLVHDAVMHALHAVGLPDFVVLAIVPIVMAILSPAMAKLGDALASHDGEYDRYEVIEVTHHE